MNIQKLIETLKRHEGLRLKPYDDATGDKVQAPKGLITIGVGRNLSGNGISEDEAMTMLENDILGSLGDVRSVFGIDLLNELGDVRLGVLINMAFNLGLPRFRSFKKMITAVKARDFDEAADEMKDSHWYRRQVGNRALELVWQMRNREYGEYGDWGAK